MGEMRLHPPTPAKATYGPLRAIVREGVNEHGVDTELLVCGHILHRRQDNYGYTNASSRRCWKCRDGFPVDRASVDPKSDAERKESTDA